VIPILQEPVFTSTTIFNLFSSWWLVPPLVVWGVAPFHERNNALSDFRLQPLILNFFHWSEQSPNEPFRALAGDIEETGVREYHRKTLKTSQKH
jgi:hypothetical protein